MSEKEPEVVHLEWERVQDPERDPPPKLVVAEPEPPKRRILPDLDGPNPFRSFPQMNSWQEFASLLLFFMGAAVWFYLQRR